MEAAKVMGQRTSLHCKNEGFGCRKPFKGSKKDALSMVENDLFEGVKHSVEDDNDSSSSSSSDSSSDESD